MRELANLLVDLDERFAAAPSAIAPSGEARERTLAWIDLTFGGWWSSEADRAELLCVAEDGRPRGFVAYAPATRAFAWLRGLGAAPDVGIFGPLGVAPEARGRGLGRALTRDALAALRARGFRRALIPAVGDERLIAYYAQVAGAHVAERWHPSAVRAARAVVLASGSGSNLQAIAERARAQAFPLEIVAVVVNRPQAYALERARRLGIATRVVAWERGRESRSEYDARLLAAVRREEPDLVLLLGWMHLLAESFVTAFESVLNVHPAFLPLDPGRDDVTFPDGSRTAAFRGAHAVNDALAAGAPWIGASVHAVTTQTDRGTILTRRPLRVRAEWDASAALAHLHPIEHDLVAAAVRRWLYERP